MQGLIGSTLAVRPDAALGAISRRAHIGRPGNTLRDRGAEKRIGAAAEAEPSAPAHLEAGRTLMRGFIDPRHRSSRRKPDKTFWSK